MKISDTACPFCETSLEIERPARLAPTIRLGRAAMFAFTVAAGCGDNIVARTPPVDAKPDAVIDDAGGVPIYAAAPTPDAGNGPKQG
ncbi:MAG TPA: hypothetical protein VIV58_17960 [Kofleriaceae bacterium]